MLKVTATTADKSTTNDHGWQLNSNDPGMAVRFVRGSKMRRIQAAYDELAAALQFPWYFGENIAALVDCLGDLSWLSDNITIVCYDADELLIDEPDLKGLLFDAIKRAEHSYSEDANPLHPDRTAPATFHIIFQCDESKIDQVMKDARQLSGDCQVMTPADMQASAG